MAVMHANKLRQLMMTEYGIAIIVNLTYVPNVSIDRSMIYSLYIIYH
jgi:hypothetical protein